MQPRPVSIVADIVELPVGLSLPELQRTESYQLELTERLLVGVLLLEGWPVGPLLVERHLAEQILIE